MPEVTGVLSFTDAMTSEKLSAYARRLEELGYQEMWLPDLMGREPFLTAGFVLSHTTRLRAATGIASVYGRDPMSTAQAARTLSELYGDRFALGLGVSHDSLAGMRGHEWIPPHAKMRAYLEAVAAAEVRSPAPGKPTPVYIAANGPKLLELAGKMIDGANTYLLPPEHTRDARKILGPDKTLNVVIPCYLSADEERARKVARNGLGIYMGHTVYQKQWAQYGFGPDDQADGGSDRMIDGLIAWGDEAALRQRVAEHLDAGADRIIIFDFDPKQFSDSGGAGLLEALAPARA